MTRTIIIGDVHGMLRELESLLGRLQPTPGDTAVFVGDLVDKGPDSVGVVRRVRELADTVPVSARRGQPRGQAPKVPSESDRATRSGSGPSRTAT